MSTYYTSDAELTSVADKIRQKGGTSADLAWPQGFEDAIDAIEIGVNTNDANARTSDIMPGRTAYVGGVKITGTATSDANAIASDILSGKTAYVNGGKITGTSTAVETGDANATTNDILSGKTAYVNGSKLTGTYSRNWLGANPVLIKTIAEQNIKLSDTDYASWTPSTTASVIHATTEADTFEADIANYDYAIVWNYDIDIVYKSGTTPKAIPIKNAFTEYSSVYRRTGNITQLDAGTKETNLTTNSTVVAIKYYNASGVETFAYASYGIYASAATATFSSTTSDNPTVTVKTPPINARCSNTYMTTAMASNIDQTNSIIHLRGYVYRVDKDTCFNDALNSNVVSLFN